MLSFGVTVLPDPPYTRLVEVFQNGEGNGFDYGWTYDSHILWQESYALLPIAAVQTETIKLGHCVTNPGIRDPTITASWYATLHDVSNGRVVMGIGRGDSSRRVVGLKPVKVDEFERRLVMIKELMNGRQVEWNGKELKLEWVRDELPDIPMHVAGYGPRALGVAGRVGDGVIIQLADPQIIQWIMEHRPQGRRGGRPRPGRAQVHRLRAEPRHRRPRRGARPGALVPGDGLEPRDGPDRALRRGLRRDPERADRLRQGAASSTTTRTTAASAPRTASSSPTRSATASACSATPSRSPRSCASSRASASTSSTST